MTRFQLQNLNPIRNQVHFNFAVGPADVGAAVDRITGISHPLAMILSWKLQPIWILNSRSWMIIRSSGSWHWKESHNWTARRTIHLHQRYKIVLSVQFIIISYACMIDCGCSRATATHVEYNVRIIATHLVHLLPFKHDGLSHSQCNVYTVRHLLLS